MRVRNAKVEIFSVKACGYGERVTEFKHFDNVRFYFCGGSGGECADDRSVGKFAKKLGYLHIGRSEILSPLRNAVGFVHRQHGYLHRRSQ